MNLRRIYNTSPACTKNALSMLRLDVKVSNDNILSTLMIDHSTQIASLILLHGHCMYARLETEQL
ncbi:hypothetical protein [Metabacillus sp. FJAT-53654]|uniref:Uncharacterized protein n=1 Tax=Metabacillus rhizosphaerae TaxID=3117747 RepID=A0ABZ2N045_9BACI